ncbi:MAG: hypothetical protein ACR2FH_03415, partial [Caulobacteraceae bacterium]
MERGAWARWFLTARTPDEDDELVARAGRGEGAAIAARMARKLPRLLARARRRRGDPAEAEDVA